MTGAGATGDTLRYVLPRGVAAIEVDGVAYVAPVPQGPISVLEGSAAVIWHEALAGPAAGITDRVAATAGVAPDEVRDSVAEFLAALVRHGLLVLS